MTRKRIQSDLKNARDQLFLTDSEGPFLSVVGDNLGVVRPDFGFTDDSWRYALKEIALQSKQVRNIFYRVLEVVLGPQKTRVANFDIEPLTNESIIQFADSSNLLQVGTIILDPGLATQETVSFCYRDLVTNKVFLNTPLHQDHHTKTPYQSNFLAEDHIAGVSVLQLVDSSQFPVGYPYAIIVDRGTPIEETLVVLNNDIVLNQLTLENLTVFAHKGPKVGFLQKPLFRVAPINQLFIVLDNGATRNFPASGFIRINFDGASEETVLYTSNDVANNAINLKAPLQYAHAAGESIELVNPGAVVETCNAIQVGVNWTVQETEANKVIITVNDTVFQNTLYDVSYFHDDVPSAGTTTLAADLHNGATTITLTSSTAFAVAGIINISGHHLFYAGNNTGTGVLSLTQAYAGTTISAGTTITSVLHGYGIDNLEEGNVRQSDGNLQQEEFSGPYIYDIDQDAPSQISGFLHVAIPAPTSLGIAAPLGTTSLQVLDASNYPTPAFTPFHVRVGVSTGAEEITTVTDVSLKSATATTVNSNTSSGSLTLAGADTTDFPQGDGINPAGYSVIIDKGGSHEEIMVVQDVTPGTPGTFTFTTTTTKTHNSSETINLMYDVLSTDLLTRTHSGPSINPTTLGHLVEKSTTSLPLGSGDGANFPNSGTVYLNFGKERLTVRQKIVSATSTHITLSNTSLFPSGDFPYKITVGEGTSIEEIATVTGNNTGTNVLTVDTMVGTFVAGQYVEFISGAPTLVDYTEKSTDTLLLGTDTYLESVYTKGERVMLSNGPSAPQPDGSSYPLKMPPDRTLTLKAMIDLVRAAGIEVDFIFNAVVND